jgi:hypothetical protein
MCFLYFFQFIRTAPTLTTCYNPELRHHHAVETANIIFFRFIGLSVAKLHISRKTANFLSLFFFFRQKNVFQAARRARLAAPLPSRRQQKKV